MISIFVYYYRYVKIICYCVCVREREREREGGRERGGEIERGGGERGEKEIVRGREREITCGRKGGKFRSQSLFLVSQHYAQLVFSQVDDKGSLYILAPHPPPVSKHGAFDLYLTVTTGVYVEMPVLAWPSLLLFPVIALIKHRVSQFSLPVSLNPFTATACKKKKKKKKKNAGSTLQNSTFSRHITSIFYYCAS